LPYASEARAALELIRDVYVVEHDAKAAGVVGTDAHTRMRQARSAPLMVKLKTLLEEQRPLHLPKGPMGSAISYALNNWEELTRFLQDARIPPDNNRSESALRVVAIGRKNFLFVGHEDAGDNIVGLFSLVATCEANDVNPLAYLTDVLGRLGSAKVLDDLLPQKVEALRLIPGAPPRCHGKGTPSRRRRSDGYGQLQQGAPGGYPASGPVGGLDDVREVPGRRVRAGDWARPR
jgi:transposase